MISVDLALRNSADILFEKISKSKAKIVIIDFKDVQSITRSFAHQYSLNKRTTAKTIEEIDMPSNVEKMMEIVSEHKERRSLFDTHDLKAVSL